jgi:hypothetical protein
MQDLERVASGWVERGWVKPEHQADVLRELEGLRPERPELTLGPVITLLVTGAIWLLTGALVTAVMLSGLVRDSSVVFSVAVGGPGAVALVLGALMRPAGMVLPLARGLLAAAPPLLTLGLLGMMEAAFGYHGESLIVYAALLPSLACLLGALVEGSRAWSATSALTAALTALLALQQGPWSEGLSLLASVGALLAAGGLSVLTRLLPQRATTLQVTAPSLVLFLASTLVMSEPQAPALWRAMGMEPLVEKALLELGAGVVLVGFGAISRSPFTLVPALMLVCVATVVLASMVGSWVGGTLALGAMGGLFLAGAALLWVLRSNRARLEAAGAGTAAPAG